MLCKRPTKKIEDSVKEMGGSEFIIEEKLDGERLQLHKRGNEYFYCSRYVVQVYSAVLFVEPPQLGREKITPTCTALMLEQEV